jgi:uncharacterized protein YjiS (DUF1127 family)
MHRWFENLALLELRGAAYVQSIEKRPALIGAAGRSQTLGKGIKMNFSRSFNNWRKYRQTVTELGRMTNRELHDLGIDRSDIHRVAREASAR